MRTQLRIVVAEQEPSFQAALKEIIESSLPLSVVGDAADGKTALCLLEQLKPDVIVLDSNLPVLNGIEVAAQKQHKQLSGEIVYLTSHNDESAFNTALSLGIRGYVTKDRACSDIVNCISAVAEGQSFTSPVITTYLLKRLSGKLTSKQQSSDLTELTISERKVLRLIAEYKTSREIGNELGIHYRTVENYRSNICAKLNLRGSHSLIKFALQNRSEF